MTDTTEAAIALVHKFCVEPHPDSWSLQISFGTMRAILAHIDAQAAENERLREWNRQIVEKAAAGGTLDGYRELGARVAAAESLADDLRAENKRLRDGLPMHPELFEEGPCYLCGYNGPGYYQPQTHPCAARYHAALEVEE